MFDEADFEWDKGNIDKNLQKRWKMVKPNKHSLIKKLRLFQILFIRYLKIDLFFWEKLKRKDCFLLCLLRGRKIRIISAGDISKRELALYK